MKYYRQKTISIIIGLTLFVSCGISESDLARKTYNSGYIYLFFKDDHSLEIYQASSGSTYARGCTADGKWSVIDGKVKIQIMNNYCGSDTYPEFNGFWTLKGEYLENNKHLFHLDN